MRWWCARALCASCVCVGMRARREHMYLSFTPGELRRRLKKKRRNRTVFDPGGWTCGPCLPERSNRIVHSIQLFPLLHVHVTATNQPCIHLEKTVPNVSRDPLTMIPLMGRRSVTWKTWKTCECRVKNFNTAGEPWHSLERRSMPKVGANDTLSKVQLPTQAYFHHL